MRIFQEPNRRLDFIVKSKVPTWYSILFIICLVIILMIWISLYSFQYTPIITLNGKIIKENQKLHALLHLPTKFIHFFDTNTTATLHLNIYPKNKNTIRSSVEKIIYTQENNFIHNTETESFYSVISKPLAYTLHGKKLYEGITLKATISLEKRYLIDWLIDGDSYEEN